MFPKNTRFLVVDDFATMRKIVRKVLLDLGYQLVEEADDGSTAWQKLESCHLEGQPIGVVISDWNMPKMPGIELLKKVRQDARFARLPFIMVTAESEQKQVLEAVKSGVSDYVVKPFNSQTLKEKLERVWQRHNAQASKAA